MNPQTEISSTVNGFSFPKVTEIDKERKQKEFHACLIDCIIISTTSLEEYMALEKPKRKTAYNLHSFKYFPHILPSRKETLIHGMIE